MGVEYSAVLAVGFRFHVEDMAVFQYPLNEVSHMEDRYDQKTGAKLEPVKVVDREADVYYKMPDDHEIHGFENLSEFLTEVMAADLECAVTIGENSWDGTIDDIVIGPDIKHFDEAGDYGQVTIHGDLDYEQLIKLAPELGRIKTKLEALGLKPGKPIVTVVVSVF